MDLKNKQLQDLQIENKLLIQQALSSKKGLDDILCAKDILTNEKWVLVQEKAQLEGQLKQIQRELTTKHEIITC